MITNSDISSIDRCYFEVLDATSFFIVLRSRNTGHFWHLLYTEANGHISFRISHKHHAHNDFHPQASAPSVSEACAYIKRHDAYHLRREKEKASRREARRLSCQSSNDIQK